MKRIALIVLVIAVFYGMVIYSEPLILVNGVVANTSAIPKKEIGEEKKAEASAQMDKEVLLVQYHEMFSYMISKNIEKLRPMMSEDFVLVHMTGKRESKQDYLEDIKNGQLNYIKEKTHNVEIQVYGNKARVIGQSEVTAAVYGGSQHTWPLQLTFDLEKVNGQWLQILCRASTY